MADENEEFLRRAAMRRAAAQQQAAQQAQQQAYQPPPPPARPALTPTYADEPVEVEIVYDEPQLGTGVTSHVAQALDNRDFNERTRQPGTAGRQADYEMQSRLQQKFDHQL